MATGYCTEDAIRMSWALGRDGSSASASCKKTALGTQPWSMLPVKSMCLQPLTKAKRTGWKIWVNCLASPLSTLGFGSMGTGSVADRQILDIHSCQPGRIAGESSDFGETQI